MSAVGEAVFKGIVWTPFLAVLVWSAVFVASALAYLEATFGATSYIL